ncbi:MAG: Hsp33 family molecular chaperone HslO [Myxococcales bacterium]|nr:Hsp33 family molecular chaperone HslO [Myxococcales bacterium]
MLKAMALGGQLRVIVVRSTEVARALRKAQDPGPVGAMALSRVATACLLLGATLKGRQQIGVQINGDGPLGEVYGIGDAQGHVRATVAEARADVDLTGDGRLNLPKGLGLGRFTVIKKLQADADAYRGVVPLVYGTVADDLAEYLLQSEQVHSAVGIGERLSADGFEGAGGYLIQALPGADEEALAELEQRLSKLPPLGDFFADGGTPDALVELLFDDADVLQRYPATFHVPASRERYARILVGLGSAELTKMKEEHEVLEIRDHFSGEVYTFNQEELGALIYGAKLNEARWAQQHAEEN